MCTGGHMRKVIWEGYFFWGGGLVAGGGSAAWRSEALEVRVARVVVVNEAGAGYAVRF
jgi:hypothetical protein